MPQFIWSAAGAGLLLACLVGPLGSIVVWRRLSYFGETLAHASLLGFALGALTALPAALGTLLACMAIAALLTWMRQQTNLSSDTVLGILSHGSLALGVVAIGLLPASRVNLETLLFGDLLAVSSSELYLMTTITLLVLPLILYFWRPLVAWAVHAELAQIEGLPVKRLELLFMLLMAVTIAAGMRVVGAILITALLIIPAATARRIANSPEKMAVMASLIAAGAVIAGLGLSLFADTPAGPSVIVASLVIFLCSHLLPRQV